MARDTCAKGAMTPRESEDRRWLSVPDMGTLLLGQTSLRKATCLTKRDARIASRLQHTKVVPQPGPVIAEDMTRPCAVSLRAILKRHKTLSRSQYVFVRFGERVDKALWYTAPLSRHTLSEQFKKQKLQMGLPWDAVLHSTRHTALTDFGAAGADAFTIQQIAGHASVTTSQRYIHPLPETIQRAVARLEQYRKMEV